MSEVAREVDGGEVPVRCILLGASNVTLGFPLIAEALVRTLPAGSEVFAAHGHGRSYLRWSSVFHRSLPGIVRCRLWEDLAERPPATKTLALVTDVGNDLIYGESHDALAEGVAWCLDRFRERNAVTVCVRPPLERLGRLSPTAYRLFKNVFFPGPTRPWEEMRELAIRLDGTLQELSATRGATVVVPSPEWYGIDPIHIRRSRRPEAWGRILSHWTLDGGIPVRAVSPWTAYAWWRLRPAERQSFRTTRTHPQPVREDPASVRLWLY